MPQATLIHERDRALGDLLEAERQLRQHSERITHGFRQLLLETAVRLDGERLEAIRRDDPSAPASWTLERWKLFMDAIPAARGWGASAVPSDAPSPLEKDLLQQIERLKAQLEEVFQLLDAEKERVVSADLAESVEMETPEGATIPLQGMITDALRILPGLPKRPPAAFAKVITGGKRVGGDLDRAFERYWVAVYLIGTWRLCAAMEIEEVVAKVVNVSPGSGSLRRAMDDLTEANILVTHKLEMESPHTALKLHRLSADGERLYQELFRDKPVESDWSKLIRLHEGERFPEHTLAVLIFAMHARKRGWMTRILPEQTAEVNATPDVWIGKGNEAFHVEVELGRKERVPKWRNQAKLNGGKVAICAGNADIRQRLVGDCKLDKLPGFATDLEALIKAQYKTLDHTSPLWLEQW